MTDQKKKKCGKKINKIKFRKMIVICHVHLDSGDGRWVNEKILKNSSNNEDKLVRE